VLQVLVKWSSLPESLATWEDLEALKQRFLKAPAWGQVVAYGGGNVTTMPALLGDKAGKSDSEEKASGSMGRCENKRVRRPNANVIGPEWISQ
jgi:hypothetical protein